MEEKNSYYLVNTTQGSNGWKLMRKCRITMSNIGKVVGHAPYYKGTDEELGMELMGTKFQTFRPEELLRMNRGTFLEPYVRNLVSKKLGKKIKETGFAIWKKDQRFGASLDGVIDDECGIEIKCPARMYYPIVDYMKRDKKTREENKKDYSHIWKSQYDQVVGNGVITGRKYMYFCVFGIEDKLLFMQKIKVDYDYFYKDLYPKAVYFYENYMIGAEKIMLGIAKLLEELCDKKSQLVLK